MMGGENSYTCGDLEGYGNYSSGQTVSMFSTITSVPTYWVKIRITLLYIDFWRNNSNALLINGVESNKYRIVNSTKDVGNKCSVETARTRNENIRVMEY